MSNYTKSTDFASKDTLPSGDSAKIVRGTEIDAEFEALETAVNSKYDSASTIAVANGGTGATTAAGARTNLGLGTAATGNIGTDVQAYDADLDSWAGKTAPSGTVVGTTDTQTLSNKTISGDLNMTSGSKYKVSGVTTNALAWVNFNGTGTVAIRSSYNVSSITDNGTGDYTVNFTTALADANYAMAGSIRNTQTYAQIQVGAPVIAQSTAPTTTALRVTTPTIGDGNTRANIDSDYVSVTIFGN